MASTSPQVHEGASIVPTLDAPLALSLPAILRNPKPSVAAHLHQPARAIGKQAKLSSKRLEGKRAARRRDNDTLASNPHAVAPSKLDALLLPSRLPTATFPSPLPPHLLPRTRPAPSPSPPSADPISSAAGEYSMSRKGLRRALKGRGARTEDLVRIVDGELSRWKDEMDKAFVILKPGGSEARIVDGTAVESGKDDGEMVPAIVEVSRGTSSLIWAIAQSFERFVVHICCRQADLVSFSITHASGLRVTHITRKQAPSSFLPPHGLSTPPITDASSVGGTSDSDLASSAAAADDAARWEISSVDDSTDADVDDNELPAAILPSTLRPRNRMQDLSADFFAPSPVPELDEMPSAASTDREGSLLSSGDESLSETDDADSLAGSVADLRVSASSTTSLASPSTASAQARTSQSTPRPSRVAGLSSSLARSAAAEDEEQADEALTPRKK